jgi:CubicO group peptidase (beta-lactamase class C family)
MGSQFVHPSCSHFACSCWAHVRSGSTWPKTKVHKSRQFPREDHGSCRSPKSRPAAPGRPREGRAERRFRVAHRAVNADSYHVSMPRNVRSVSRRVFSGCRSHSGYLAVAGCFAVLSCACTSTYLGRYVCWSPSSIEDHKLFPARKVSAATQPFVFRQDAAATSAHRKYFESVEYRRNGRPRSAELFQLLNETATTAFIIVRGDTVLYETYLNGHSRDSLVHLFSVSKSFTSALVGIALSSGLVKSIDDAFVTYIPELKGKGFDAVMIRNLLTMSAGFRFTYGPFPWVDNVKLYYHPDLRRVVVEDLELTSLPGAHFHYSNFSTMLLAMILERTTQRTLSELLEEQLWKPLGMEYAATWSIDHAGNGIEAAASGLNTRAIDLVKFGKLYLDRGQWLGRQILPRAWVEDSVLPDSGKPGDYYSEAEQEDGIYYGYQWWGHRLRGRDFNFYASGYLGQLIYVCPKKNLVIVRLGKETGDIDGGWPSIARAICDKL